jgi:hypothetical protein
MALDKVAQFTETKRLMKDAGININNVLRDGIWMDGYEVILRDETGAVLSNGDDVMTKFVEWPSASAGAKIWESYRNEGGK